MGHVPEMDGASCAALLAKQRYNPDILPELEAFVDAQCANASYDLDCNLAVLKLYQFHPDKSNITTVAKILVKALMNLPATDYLLCTYLIPERVQEVELISDVAAIAKLLEKCSFRQVWEAVEPLREQLLSGVAGFDAAIGEFILRTMQITYQSIPASHLEESLNVNNTQLMEILAGRGWPCTDGIVTVTLNDDNIAKPPKVDDQPGLSVVQMTKILASTFNGV